jgi:outer membrane putative beta-barrel porin/alpha-amylase
LLLCYSPTVLAGPPFVTDDPEPVDYQHWEFYLASQHTETAAGWSVTAPHFELNYGVVPKVQLHLIAPLAYDAPSGGSTHYGSGDTEVGVKYRFIQETKHLPQVGIFPLMEIPTGSESDGLGSGHVQAFRPLWLQKSFGDWTIYGGGGYGINPGVGNENWGFGGVVVQRQVTKNFLLGTEIYHRTTMETSGRDDTAFNIGTVIDFTENQHLLFSAGRSIDGPTDFQVYVAYQFTFGPEFFHSNGNWGCHR